MRGGRIIAPALALALLAACAPSPMTPERAARECRAEAPLADGFAGRVGVGAGSRGASAKAGVTITNRVFSPQSRADFMANCIDRKLSGAPQPTTVGVTIGGSL